MRRFAFAGTRRFAFLAAFVAVAIVLATSLSLLRYQHVSAGDSANDRTYRLERFGSQAATADNAIPDTYWDTLEMGLLRSGLGGDVPIELTDTSSASWELLNYEFAHLFASDPPCRMSLYAIGDEPTATGNPATVQFFLNGRLAETMQVFGKPIPGAVYYEHGVSTQPIFFGPLFQPSGHVIPLKWDACHQDHWTVELRLKGVRWKIARLGAVATFTPLRPSLTGSTPALVAIGALEAAGLTAGFFALFFLVYRRYGPVALTAAVLVTLGATLTHDQWDFPVWVRFVDLLAFGHGNPVAMTAGSPLWAYATSVAAPVMIATYALFNYGSNEVAALVLKLTMALAYVATAYLLSRVANLRVRRMAFLIALLSPLSLYGLAGGYREVTAGVLAVAGLLLTVRRRQYVLAAIAFAAAGTISEALLPLTLLPAAAAMLGWRGGASNVLRSLGYAVLALGLVCVPWLTLSRNQFATAVAFRSSNYRFGGASWYSVLESYNVPLQFVRDHGLLVNVLSFALLSVPFAIAYVRLLLRKGDSDERRTRGLLYAFLGFEFAFFLSYTGVDPATWYSLIAVVFFVLTVTDPFNPYPIVLSSLCGLAFYAIVGLGDFVNWTYLWPLDVGLFGILGHPMFIFVGLANLMILAGWIAAARGDFRIVFGPRSLAYLAIFTAAGFAATIFQYPEDVALCMALVGLVAYWIAATMGISRRRGNTLGVPDFRYFAMLVGVAGAYRLWAEGLSPAWTIGIALAALAWSAEAGLADPIAIGGAMWLIGTEPGGGWLSTAGYLLLFALLLAALWRAYGGPLRGLLARRPKLGVTRISIQWESAASRAASENNHHAPAPPPATGIVVERPTESQLRN